MKLLKLIEATKEIENKRKQKQLNQRKTYIDVESTERNNEA